MKFLFVWQGDLVLSAICRLDGLSVLIKLIFCYVMNIIFLSLALSVAALSPSMSSDTQVNAASAVQEESRSSQMIEVSSVYGVDSVAYKAALEGDVNRIRPQVRSVSRGPSFDIPDAFYYVLAPVFFAIFIRLFITFLEEIEQKRIQELREEHRDHHGAQ